MRAAFLGTPSSAIPSLAALASVAEVAVVVTRPDRPRGRSGRPQPPPVKVAAAEWGLAVEQPRRPADIAGRLAALDLDVAVVVAYGHILPAAMLEVPGAGFVNVHFSVLPRWRGAAPVARAILAGDRTTGVSLMQLDAGMDTGPLLAVEAVTIGERERAGELTARLAARGAALLADVLPGYVAGDIVPEPQDDRGAVAAPRLDPDEGRIHPARSADEIDRMVRALHPWPGTWGTVDGRRLKILATAPAQGFGLDPGEIVFDEGRALLGTGDGALQLLEVQPDGRPAMLARDWGNGRRNRSAVLE